MVALRRFRGDRQLKLGNVWLLRIAEEEHVIIVGSTALLVLHAVEVRARHLPRVYVEQVAPLICLRHFLRVANVHEVVTGSARDEVRV